MCVVKYFRRGYRPTVAHARSEQGSREGCKRREEWYTAGECCPRRTLTASGSSTASALMRKRQEQSAASGLPLAESRRRQRERQRSARRLGSSVLASGAKTRVGKAVVKQSPVLFIVIKNPLPMSRLALDPSALSQLVSAGDNMIKKKLLRCRQEIVDRSSFPCPQRNEDPRKQPRPPAASAHQQQTTSSN